MKYLKTLMKLKILMTALILFLATGCVGDSVNSSGSPAASPSAVNRVVGTSFTVSSFPSSTEKIIDLIYTDLDGTLGTTCSIGNLSNVFVTRACLCDISGLCSIGIKSTAGYIGSGNFTFNVVSGGRTSTTGTVNFTITSGIANEPPLANNLTPSNLIEDVQSLITLSYTDTDFDLATSCSLTGFVNLIETQACTCNGSGVCTVGVTSVSNYSGSGSFQYTVLTNSQLSNTANVNLSITAINDTPTISTVTSQTTSEGVVVSSIPFTIGDIDSTINCTDVVGSSSNVALVANSAIVIAGTAPNCNVSVTPSSGISGVASITLTLTDAGTPLPALLATTIFTLTVSGVNTPPTISAVGDQTTNEDILMPAKSFTIADIDSAVNCSNVTATSSNTTIVPSANITISGTAPNCNVTVNPASNQSGAVLITLLLTDLGTPLPALSASSSFTLTIVPVNDAPTISVIADQSTNEGVATSQINFSILDVDSVISCNTNVVGTSSNISLVPNANIVVSGTAPSCSIVITPLLNQNGSTVITLTLTDAGMPLPALQVTSAFNLTVGAINSPPTISFLANSTTDEDTSIFIDFVVDDLDSSPLIVCSSANLSVFSSSNGLLFPGISGSDVVFSGTYPNCRATFTPLYQQSGTSNIVIRVTDNGSPIPTKSTDSNIFTITVNPFNNIPIISSIADQVVNKNVATGALSFTISDSDSTVACTNVTATSSDVVLVPNASIVISGTSPNCSVNITPALNQIGISTITLTLTDTGTPLPAKTAQNIFTLTVNALNTAPTITTISPQSINEDASTTALAFAIADLDSNVTCSDVVASSSDTSKVANVNIVIGGSAPNCTATITPLVDANGTVTVTLTLTDLGTPLPAKTANSSFVLTINPINDSPVISTILAKSTDEDIASSSISFTISDVDSVVTCANVTGASSNTTIVPNANIVISGTAPNCSAIITGANNQNGLVNITLTLTDLGTPMPALAATSIFALTIVPVPDLSGAIQMSGIASSYTSNSYARKMNFASIVIDEAITAIDTCLSHDSNANLILDTLEMCNVQNWLDITTAISASGTSNGSTWANFLLKDGANGAAFTVSESPLKNSCSVTNTYWFSINVINASSRESNIVTSSAWTFWEPTCLGSNLAQWLDATETSTITIDTGVSSWADKSSFGRTITQTTLSLRPLYSATALGADLPGVTFDGSNDILTREAFAYAQGSASFFTVIKAPTAGATKYVFSEGKTASGTNYYSPLVKATSSTIGGRIENNAGTNVLNETGLSSVFFNNTIILAMAEDTGSSFYTYSNGTAQSVAAIPYTRGASTIDLYVLGARQRSAAASFHFTGSIGEFIITNGVLSATDRQKLESYSAHKWGTSANLPVSNPFQVTPP